MSGVNKVRFLTETQLLTTTKINIMAINKNIVIEDFEVSSSFVYVQWSNPNDTQNETFTVIKGMFEAWMQNTNRLEWVLDHVSNGEHEQHTGVALIDDYWQNAEYDLKRKDLKDYILSVENIKN